jgi:hypothetical protein
MNTIEVNNFDIDLNIKELFTSSLIPQIAIVIDEEVVATLQLTSDIVAALLSNPKLVAFFREGETTHIHSGLKYVNGKFVFPNNWTIVDGVPTPPTIIT